MNIDFLYDIKSAEELAQANLKKKIWINRADSFSSAQDFDTAYYLRMSSEERLETVQLLRETFWKMNKGLKHEGRERLRRVIKIIQQT